MMWGSKCSWVLERDRKLDAEILRQALQELEERHQALGCGRVLNGPLTLDASNKIVALLVG